jgi:hypothetical protein
MANRNKPLSDQALRAERAVAALEQHLNWQKWAPARQVQYLFELGPAPGQFTLAEQPSVLAQLHLHCVANRPYEVRQHIREFLLALAGQRTELLRRPELASALAALGANYHRRLRQLADWHPKTKNVHTQLESLVRHLFDQYGDVPAWVIGAWTARRTANLGLNLMQLTLHLGRGQSLRSFAGLPLPLTKRMEHEMRQAPAACTVLEALRYAQLAVRGCLDWFGVVLESRLGREVVAADDNFWLGVVDFFRAAPEADPRQFGPVCDWIHQKRTVGIGHELPQPGFSLKGRSLASILVQTAAWHRRLAQLHRHGGKNLDFTTNWPGLPVPNYEGGDEGRVRITQLTTFSQLVDEGRSLQHCVASYVELCRLGRCGIFALTLDGRPTITLEVSEEREVVQARGRHNRRMAADERHWVNRWVREAQLRITAYV